MRAEMLAVLVFAARPNNNSNANTNGNTTNADTMNASNNTKAGGGAMLQHQQQQEQQVTNEQQQQQQPLLVRSHSEQLPTSPTRPNDDLLDASASTRSSSANKGFIRAATTGTGDVRPSVLGGGGEPSIMPALKRQQKQWQSQQQLQLHNKGSNIVNQSQLPQPQLQQQNRVDYGKRVDCNQQQLTPWRMRLDTSAICMYHTNNSLSF